MNVLEDDGLLGQEPYELDSEALKTLKWTDLIDESNVTSTEGENTAPVATLSSSNIRTQVLAEKRLLSLPLVNSLVHNRKYEYLTPVQAQTLFPILNNESVVVRAKTGTGKTAAFSIPLVQKVLESKAQGLHARKVKAIIVSPTRELAQQIADEIYKITQYGGLSSIKVQCLVGGIPKDVQLRAAGLLGGARADVADIIVATPGRLNDVLQDDDIVEKFNEVQFRVFDEADRILDIGFERAMQDIRERLDSASGGREIPLLLFSATADKKMREFAKRQSGGRVRLVDTVPPNEPTANELVEQHAEVCPTWADVYHSATKQILDSYEASKADGGSFKAIVFLPTTLMVDHYERVVRAALGRRSPLARNVLGVHGRRTQSSRQSRSDRFRREKDAVLITTDVVARGMDFPNVSHVFQIGAPTDTASYVHRIGRTARIGHSGKSHLYYTDHMRGYVDALAKENIRPQLRSYEHDDEFRESVQKSVSDALAGDEEADELLFSLMSYMTNYKAKFPLDSEQFLKDMDPFVKMLGLEKLRLSAQMQSSWRGAPNFRRRGTGYGSSRRSRMRW